MQNLRSFKSSPTHGSKDGVSREKSGNQEGVMYENLFNWSKKWI